MVSTSIMIIMQTHLPYSWSGLCPCALRLVVVLACLFLISAAGCQTHPPATNYTSPENAQTSPAPLSLEQRELQEITDSILRALTTYDYDRLTAIEQNRIVTGHRVAQKLLGPRPKNVVIEQWNATQIRVELAPDNRHATAAVPVTYRPTPNREPRTTEFTFHFVRTNAAWRLDLNPPS
jgi:type IV pilus biogenesis protein CpaD/CtpE